MIHYPLMNSRVPSNVAFFFSHLFSIANFDIFQSDYLLQYLFYSDDDHEYNDHFDFLGYSSSLYAINLGSEFIFIHIYLVLLLTCVLLHLLQKFKNPNLVYQKLRTSLMWNGTLRFALESYLMICISTMVSLKQIVWTEGNFTFNYNFIVSCVSLVFLVGFPIWMGIFYWRKRD